MTEHMVYILECKDGTYYTGYTNDFDRRIKAHESGKGAKYTRGRAPFKVLLRQSYETKEEAMKQEALIKKWPRHKKEAFIRERRDEDAYRAEKLPE